MKCPHRINGISTFGQRSGRAGFWGFHRLHVRFVVLGRAFPVLMDSHVFPAGKRYEYKNMGLLSRGASDGKWGEFGRVLLNPFSLSLPLIDNREGPGMIGSLFKEEMI